MDQPLLTIGGFARAVGLTPSALRFYDECGLLRPAEVDDATGYRYYTPDLQARAHAVARMREAGVSIETMRSVLDGSADERRRVLREVLVEQEAMALHRAAVLEELIAGTSPDRARSAIEVDGLRLAAAIRQVRAAAANDPTSPLCGVLLDVSAGSVDVVATNRYWMAVRTVPTSPGDDARAVVSLPDAARLCDLLEQHDRTGLEVGDTHVGVLDDVLPAREVAYPAHRMLLAGLSPTTTRVVLSRVELLEAIDVAGRADLDLTVAAGGTRIGGSELSGPVVGPRLSLRLGAALLRRAVECAVGPELVMRMTSARQPVQLSSPYQPDFVALLMPIAGSSGDTEQ